MVATYSDAGNFFATSALVAVEAAIAAAELPAPGQIFQVGGTTTPFQDPCDGLLYARVASVYPSDGSGGLFAAARIDFDLPAWAFAIEVGIMFCRSNLDDDGTAVSPEDEADYATRDGSYRMALLDGIGSYYPDEIRAYAGGYTVSPWSPIGPDGAVSGGLVVATVVTGRLCIPVP